MGCSSSAGIVACARLPTTASASPLSLTREGVLTIAQTYIMHQTQPFQLLNHHRRFWRRLSLGLLALGLVLLTFTQAAPAAKVSNYELAQAATFNQVESYPIQPLPSSPNFRPNGGWIGRLILPSEQDYADAPGDWAWFEVWHSPDDSEELLGQIIKLTWRESPENEAYLETVTRDITFNQQAENFLENGNIVPVRLNGRKQVGPLQSLAGARPKDDVTVRLVETELVNEQGQPVLKTALEPIQIKGREYGLVKILEPDNTVEAPLPAACPGDQPCPTEYFRVQIFDPTTRDFTGPIGTIRIPQQPMLNGERFFSNIRDLTDSPAGREGWYVLWHPRQRWHVHRAIATASVTTEATTRSGVDWRNRWIELHQQAKLARYPRTQRYPAAGIAQSRWRQF
jgi:predicted Abi (CAAX) family protease